MRRQIQPIGPGESDKAVGRAFCAASYRLYRSLTRTGSLVYEFESYEREFGKVAENFSDYLHFTSTEKLLALFWKQPEFVGLVSERKRILRTDFDRVSISIAGERVPEPFYLCARVLQETNGDYGELGKRVKEAAARSLDIRDIIRFLADYKGGQTTS